MKKGRNKSKMKSNKDHKIIIIKFANYLNKFGFSLVCKDIDKSQDSQLNPQPFFANNGLFLSGR